MRDAESPYAWRRLALALLVAFDLTGSYSAAFVNGIAWNLLNLSIAGWLLRRPALRTRYAAP